MGAEAKATRGAPFPIPKVVARHPRLLGGRGEGVMDAKERPNLTVYEAKLIRYKARRLAGSSAFFESEREDIEQDLTVHLLERLEQFDPRRGTRTTFASRILDRKIISMIRWRCAQRRDYRRMVSLSDSAKGNGDGTLQVVDRRQTKTSDHLDLAMDLSESLDQVDGETRRFCESLKRVTLAETARRLGLTPAEGRRCLTEVRALLTNGGIDIYAEKATDGVDRNCVSNE